MLQFIGIDHLRDKCANNNSFFFKPLGAIDDLLDLKPEENGMRCVCIIYFSKIDIKYNFNPIF